jgi:hypothetical protein
MTRAHFSYHYLLENEEVINPNGHNDVAIETTESRTEPIESLSEQDLACKNHQN